MQWFLEHPQIVVLIGLAFASWLKRRADLRTAGQEQRQEPPTATGADDELDPGTTRRVPPPLVRAVIPPTLSPAPAGNAAMLRRQQELQDQLLRLKDSKATITGGAAATRTRVSAAQRHSKAVRQTKAVLHASLHHPKEIRRAIIMREILGPPLGLR